MSTTGNRTWAGRALAFWRWEPSPVHRAPAWWRLALATAVSIALCLLADAALVAVGTAVFPATKGYVHFRFGDYGKLTVIGVVIACAAWPVVVRLTSAPRWVFARLAVLVTGALLLPDLYIWHQGQPARAVLVLVWMHLAIGLVTYTTLVRLAPPREGAPAVTVSDLVAPPARPAGGAPAHRGAQEADEGAPGRPSP